MTKTHDLQVWYISWRQAGREIADTKYCTRNYITAAAYARRYARELGTCDKIVLERSDSFKLYTIEL